MGVTVTSKPDESSGLSFAVPAPTGSRLEIGRLAWSMTADTSAVEMTRASRRCHDPAGDPATHEPGRASALECSMPMTKAVSLMTPRIENLATDRRTRVLFGSK
jgi:hypothetical protein